MVLAGFFFILPLAHQLQVGHSIHAHPVGKCFFQLLNNSLFLLTLKGKLF